MRCGENDINARDLPPWTLEEGAQGVEPLLILEVEVNRHLRGLHGRHPEYSVVAMLLVNAYDG